MLRFRILDAQAEVDMKGVVIVRGLLRDLPENELREAHDRLLDKLKGPGRDLGNTGHRAYRNVANPRELMVVDSWEDIDGAEKLMSNPDLPGHLGKFFDGTPDVAIWSQTDWDGYDQ